MVFFDGAENDSDNIIHRSPTDKPLRAPGTPPQGFVCMQ
jgi:hypothetical protein